MIKVLHFRHKRKVADFLQMKFGNQKMEG